MWKETPWRNFWGKHPQICGKMYQLITTVTKFSCNCLESGVCAFIFNSENRLLFQKSISGSGAQSKRVLKYILNLCFQMRTSIEFHGEKTHFARCKSAVNKSKQHFPEIFHELCTPRVSSKLGTYQMAGQQWPMRIHTRPSHISCITTCSLPRTASHIDHEYISLENRLYTDEKEFGNCPARNSRGVHFW